jgi:hypothetical protein
VLALVDTDCTGVDVLPRWAIFEKLGMGYSPSASGANQCKSQCRLLFCTGGISARQDYQCKRLH